MTEHAFTYTTRFFAKNPGGAYDPAPLHEFDMDGLEHPGPMLPGDTISAWSRMSGEAEGRNRYYKVIERMFRFDAGAIDVFVLVEEVSPGWTQKFD